MPYDDNPRVYNYWVWPATTTRISGYNYAGSHKGIDIGVPSGGQILAPTAGKVTKVGWDAAGYGLYVVIRTWDNKQVYLAHLSKAKVKVNDYVVPGEVVGKGGSTGNSTGPHLHYEIRTGGGGGWINPWSIYGSDPEPGIPYDPPGNDDTISPPGGIPPGTNPRSPVVPGDPGTDNPFPWDSLIPGSPLEGIGQWLAGVDWDSVAFAAMGIAVVLIGGFVLAGSEGAGMTGRVIAGAIKDLAGAGEG